MRQRAARSLPASAEAIGLEPCRAVPAGLVVGQAGPETKGPGVPPEAAAAGPPGRSSQRSPLCPLHLDPPCLSEARPPNFSRDGVEEAVRGVIIYEDFPTGIRARRFWQSLARELAGQEEPGAVLWSSGVLAIPEVCEEALRGALAAHFVLLSLRGRTPMPPVLWRWLERWLERVQRNEPTLIALFDPASGGEGDVEETRARLRETATAAGVAFYAHTSLGLGPAAPLLAPGVRTVLVVEGHHMLCDFLAESLVPAGYRVLTAATAERARELVLAGGAQSIDLLLAGWGGSLSGTAELVNWLARWQPAMKVLFMGAAPQPRLAEGWAFLQKPFGLEALLAKVGAVLRGDAGA